MNVVALGGGHGLARCLTALRLLDLAPTAVVTVADDGGSSGRLRADLGIIALGDLRMALFALAEHVPLADALAHRFKGGELEGHALGNLLLVALAEQAEGDVVVALDRAGELLGCRGRVLPATTVPVNLEARVAGQDVTGQVRIATADGVVERAWLAPSNPPACKQSVAAVEQADTVVIGPGSLYTSLIATLLVPELAEALAATAARVVYVANVGTQMGETTGLDADAHVRALLGHVPGLRLDTVLLHDGPAPPPPSAGIGWGVADPRVAQLVRADVITRDVEGNAGRDHDPKLLAQALEPLL